MIAHTPRYPGRMECAMLRDLTIKNYRCFKDFSIDGLARVNLIVGQNNSGKTSFLEAVYLLVNQFEPTALLELLDARGEFVYVPDSQGQVDYALSHIYYRRSVEGAEVNSLPHSAELPDQDGQLIEITSSKDEALSLQIQEQPARSSFGYPRPGTDLHFAYAASIEQAKQAFSITAGGYSPSKNGRIRLNQHSFRAVRFVTNEQGDASHLAQLWEIVGAKASKEQAVLDALRILEPRVEDIRFINPQTSNGILLQRRGEDERFPLSSLGAGMRRVLALAMSAVTAEQGFLLIDEIETGIYHTAQADIWRLLLETAQNLNVQVFATTHSWECIVAFQEALAQTRNGQDDLGVLFRLQERGGEVIAVDYDADKLDVAVDHMIEVR
jgi:predicted ATPase